jgi:RNA-directed DNA polymerase
VDGSGVSRGAEVMNPAIAPMSQWHTRGWTKSARQGCKRQNRLDRAAKRAEHRQVRRLQTLGRRSRAAKRFAVRKGTQENQGQQTPGVAGVAPS